MGSCSRQGERESGNEEEGREDDERRLRRTGWEEKEFAEGGGIRGFGGPYR